MKIKILGKCWNLKFAYISKITNGKCDSPNTPKKEIKISPKLKGEKKLRILLHEMLHASFWVVDEETIDECSTDLARILYKLGYRDMNEENK